MSTNNNTFSALEEMGEIFSLLKASELLIQIDRLTDEKKTTILTKLNEVLSGVLEHLGEERSTINKQDYLQVCHQSLRVLGQLKVKDTETISKTEKILSKLLSK